jgi:signal peptidase I
MFLKRLGAFFLDILEVIVFAIAIFLFVYLLILQPHKIKGSSMEPNFPDREFLMTDKLSYRFKQPQRGDVVVFEAPGTNGDEFIKRIIGLPGEEVSIKDNKIYINSKMLVEPYLSSQIQTRGGSFLDEGNTVIVPNEHYFVLGDNRDASSDSRRWGFVSKEKITGRAWIVYWPPPSVGFVPSVSYSFGSGY